MEIGGVEVVIIRHVELVVVVVNVRIVVKGRRMEKPRAVVAMELWV